MPNAAARNRAQFPFAAQIVDELRAVLGPGVQIEWAQENAAEIGRRVEGRSVSVAQMVIRRSKTR